MKVVLAKGVVGAGVECRLFVKAMFVFEIIRPNMRVDVTVVTGNLAAPIGSQSQPRYGELQWPELQVQIELLGINSQSVNHDAFRTVLLEPTMRG